MRVQKAFYYDQNLCIGCHACQTACMVTNKLDVGMNWRRVYDHEAEFRGRTVDRHLSVACHHCEKPACIDVCPAGAYTKQESDGLVVQDHAKCIGCGACIDACPYKAPQMNAASKRVEKCHGCHALVAQGQPPACVTGCPVQILKWDNAATLDAAGAVKDALGFAVMKTRPAIRFVPRKV